MWYKAPQSSIFPLRRPSSRKRNIVLAVSLIATIGIATIRLVTHASGNPLGGAVLFVDSANNPAATQAASWRASRPADATQMDKIASHAKGFWMGDWIANPQAAAADYTTRAATSGAVGTIVAYNIPGRDCGNYSAGGAVDGTAYRAWTAAVAAGIGGRKTIVILEPDALGLLTNCLTAAQQSERLALLSDAVSTYTAKGALVYVEASTWIPPADMASRLTAAGIGKAAGFSDNVSGFDTTAVLLSYNSQVSQALGGATHFVIDTSRNGLGPVASEWCNPAGRALGSAPTVNTGLSLLDAYLWIKYPGESDGTCNGGPSAGSWWADYALGLAQRAPIVVTPLPTPPPTATPTPIVAAGAGTYNDDSFTYSANWLAGGATAGANTIARKYHADDHYSNITGATYTFAFTGAQARVYASKDASHGIEAYSVDGRVETLVDAYSPARQDQVLMYTTPALGSGLHTLRVRITGTSNPASTGMYGNADRIDVLAVAATPPPPTPAPTPTPTPSPAPTPNSPASAGKINDSNFRYSGAWSVGNGTAKYQGDDHYTRTKGAAYSLTFTGKQAKVYGAVAPIHGQVSVSVDGATGIVVDQYGVNRIDQSLLYTSPMLISGVHTITITVLGTKNNSSTDTWVNADRIDVLSPAPTTTPIAPTPTPNPSPTPPMKLLGDINSDGHVNVLDLSLLLAHWGSADTASDINHDGTVNVLDMSLLLSNWKP